MGENEVSGASDDRATMNNEVTQVEAREIETVKLWPPGEKGEPFWRIEIDGICADFDHKEAAENFAAAINARVARIQSVPPARADVVEALEQLLERFGLVLTDDPDFDHDETTFEKAKAAFVAEVATLRTQAPASETKDNEPWAWGWYERGGTKRAYPHLPTVNYPADPECEPFPLYRAPPQAPASDGEKS